MKHNSAVYTLQLAELEKKHLQTCQWLHPFPPMIQSHGLSNLSTHFPSSSIMPAFLFFDCLTQGT